MFNLKAFLSIIFTVFFAMAISACSEERPSDETRVHEEAYSITERRAKIAQITMAADTSFLTGEERQVINRLILAADLMSEIYLRQVHENNPAIRAEIAASDLENRDALLDMFDLHFGRAFGDGVGVFFHNHRFLRRSFF